jgi:tetratricopeptide (TPR) repeat protein
VVDKFTLNRTLADCFYNRGLTWQRKEHFDRAIADYREAIRLNPKDARVYNSRGIAWMDRGDLDRAIGDYNDAIRIDRKMDLALRNRGNAWRSKGDLDRAIADYNEAIRLDPKDAEDRDTRAARARHPTRRRSPPDLQHNARRVAGKLLPTYRGVPAFARGGTPYLCFSPAIICPAQGANAFALVGALYGGAS